MNIDTGRFHSEYDPNLEILRKTMKEIKLIDHTDRQQLGRVHSILTAPVNEIHLANPPDSPRAVAEAIRGGTRFFGGINALGEIVSVATLSDGIGNINSHEIGNFAVDPSLQRQEPRSPGDPGIGIGTFTLEQLVLYGFTTPTWNLRERIKLRAGVMTHMTTFKKGEGWTKLPRADVMEALLKGRGFKPLGTNIEEGIDAFSDYQVTKIDSETKEEIHYRVTTYELFRRVWEEFCLQGKYKSYKNHDPLTQQVLVGD